MFLIGVETVAVALGLEFETIGGILGAVAAGLEFGIGGEEVEGVTAGSRGGIIDVFVVAEDLGVDVVGFELYVVDEREEGVDDGVHLAWRKEEGVSRGSDEEEKRDATNETMSDPVCEKKRQFVSD